MASVACWFRRNSDKIRGCIALKLTLNPRFVQGFPQIASRALMAIFIFASITDADEVVQYVPTVSIVISIPE